MTEDHIAAAKNSARSAVLPAGQPSWRGTSGDFVAPIGSNIDPELALGYYIDLRVKAPEPTWPPPWFPQVDEMPLVVFIQWALGCYEHFIVTQDQHWLEAAKWGAERLREKQVREGRHQGAWLHRFAFRHTYHLPPPWPSGMAQGQAASLFVRLFNTLGDDRFTDSALLALRPMQRSVRDGGVAAPLGDGILPEEYPTDPASHVLNGTIFALWGIHDVALTLGDAGSQVLAREGFATLAAALPRWDTGRWSRYDLYPHPLVNVASPMYHQLHVDQLRATTQINDDLRFAEMADRFAGYARSRRRAMAAYLRKVAFRIAVPRNSLLAHRLPWARANRT